MPNPEFFRKLADATNLKVAEAIQKKQTPVPQNPAFKKPLRVSVKRQPAA